MAWVGTAGSRASCGLFQMQIFKLKIIDDWWRGGEHDKEWRWGVGSVRWRMILRCKRRAADPGSELGGARRSSADTCESVKRGH